MAGIMDMFRTQANSAPATAQGQPLPGGQQQQPNQGMNVNNPAADPANQNLGANGTGAGGTGAGSPPNPLDNFKDLFTITPDDMKKQPQDPFAQPLLNMDQKKFAEAASKMNFAAGISPEDLAKAFPGGDAQTISTILNRVTQSTFASAAQVFTGIMEQAFKKNNGRFDSALGSKFKSFQLDSSAPTNPALKHPALQPMLAAVRSSVAAKNPHLSAVEIAQQAEEYMSVMADALSKAGKGESSEGGAANTGDIDWGKFLNI